MIDAHRVELREELRRARPDEGDGPGVVVADEAPQVLPRVEHRVAPWLPDRVRAARRSAEPIAREKEVPAGPAIT